MVIKMTSIHVTCLSTGACIQLVKSSVMDHMTLVNYLVSIDSAFEVVMCHV